MDLDKLIDIRMRCVEIAGGINRSSYEILENAKAYFELVTSIIPVPLMPAESQASLDDEIPF